MKVYDEGLTADIDFVTFSHDGKMDRTELRKERERLLLRVQWEFPCVSAGEGGSCIIFLKSVATDKLPMF